MDSVNPGFFRYMTRGLVRYSAGLVLLALVVGALLWFVGHRQVEQFMQQQRKLAEFSVAHAEVIVQNYLEDLRADVNLFAREHQPLYTRVLAAPTDPEHRDALRLAILEYFPNLHTFAIAKMDGTILYADNEAALAQACFASIDEYVSDPDTSYAFLRVHVGNEGYHFDILSKMSISDDASGIFFTSFSSSRIAHYLQTMQTPGHKILLVKEQAGELIEMSASDSRTQLVRSGHLSDNTPDFLLSEEQIDNTHWAIVDVLDPELVDSEQSRVQENMALLFAVFMAGGLLSLVIIKHHVELRAHAETELMRHQEALEAQVRERTAALKRANERLEHLSLSDGLTGVANRRHFDHVIARELRRAIRENQPMSLLMLDIDHFKRYNDAAGHLAGDEALKKIAHAIENQFMRGADLAARYGGEEFAVILPGAGVNEAIAQAERVRQVVEELQIEHPDTDVADHITVSVGVSTLREHQYRTVEDMIDGADSALYLAKSRGRNQSVTEEGLDSGDDVPASNQEKV